MKYHRVCTVHSTCAPPAEKISGWHVDAIVDEGEEFGRVPRKKVGESAAAGLFHAVHASKYPVWELNRGVSTISAISSSPYPTLPYPTTLA